MSDDAATTTDPMDASDVGERRRAIKAERERRAERERQDEPPPAPSTSLVRPYARMASPTASGPPPAPDEDADVGPEEAAPVDADVDEPVDEQMDERVDEPVEEPDGGQNLEVAAGAPDVPAAPEATTTPAAWPEPVERLRAASAALWPSGAGPGAQAVAPATSPDLEPSPPEPPAPEPPAPEPPAGWSLFTPVVPPEPLAYEDEPYPATVAHPAPEPRPRAGADEWTELSLRVGDDDAWVRGLREPAVAPGGAVDDLGPDPDEPSGTEAEPVAPPQDVADPDAREAEAVDEEAVDDEAVDDEAVDDEAVDDEAVETEAVETEAVDDEAVDDEAVDDEAVETEAVETEAVETEGVDTEAVETEAVQDDEVHSDPLRADEEPREEVVPLVPDEQVGAVDDRPLAPQAPFRRPPTERLTRALTDDPAGGPAGRSPDLADEGPEQVRGTLEPVLRRSTERAKVTPIIRPPVLPPEPDADQPGPVRAAPVSWDEAMAADVVPGRKRRHRRLARARHESGGTEEEYRPRAGADRSLTLLVLGMLLVLAILIGVAVWAFWPRALGARSLPAVTIVGQRDAAGA